MGRWGGVGWLALLLVLGGCGGGAPLLGPPPCRVAAGEVVFAAVLPAPGEDGVEALVLENRSAAAVELNRAVLEVSGGAGGRRWTLGPLSLPPGGRVSLDASRLPGLALADEGGEARLSCQGMRVHAVRWEGGVPGRWWVRDRAAPARAADDPDWWCAAEGPQARVCGLAFCVRPSGEVRAVRPLTSLRITEVMADPEGRDPGREWLELVALSAGDWNGLRLEFVDGQGRVRQWRVAASRCLEAEPGEPWVLGLGEGAPEPSAVGAGLPNGEGRLRVMSGEAVDEVALPAARSGVAWSRDPAGEVWCPGRPGVEGVASSPGAVNPPCAPACRDSRGWRALRPPPPGALWVSEVAADPEGRDQGREWLELVARGEGPLDLNGVELVAVNRDSGRERRWSLAREGAACVGMAPGEVVLLAGEAARLPEGGRRLALDLALFNGPLELRLSYQGAVIDSASLPAAQRGRALGIPWGATAFADNDLPEAWCAQRTVLEGGGSGTPGAVNEPCGDWCAAGGEWRPWRYPPEGAVVVSALGQGESDWLELMALVGDVDVNGLRLVQENAQGNQRSWRLESASCLSLRAGERLRLGVELEPPLDLYLGRSRWWLEWGEEVVDRAEVRVVRDGVVRVPGLSSAGDNDEASDWCRVGEVGCPP